MADDRDERMQGGGYGGMQGRGGEGRDSAGELGELQGGSYGRNTGRDAGTGRRPAADPDESERERLAQPSPEVDEDGQETTIEDEGRSPEWGELGETEIE